MKLIRKTFTLLAITFFLGMSSQLVNAQNTPDTYFHGGAQHWIGGDLPGAINQVQEGLNRFPNDPKLNELLAKLEEEKQNQQQQQQQNQDQQEQQNQDQQQNEEQNQDQQNQEQEEQQQDQQQNDEQQQDQQDQQQAQPQDAREISKEEAQKILQALAQKEKELLKEFKKQKPQGSATHDKDW